MDSNTYKKYRDLKIEDLIWGIYFLILIGNLYSNKLQEDNYTHKKYTNPKDISKVNITILTTVFFIYVYFFYRSYNELKDSFQSNNQNKINLNSLTLLASFLFLIGGAIFIYVEANSIGDDEIGII